RVAKIAIFIQVHVDDPLLDGLLPSSHHLFRISAHLLVIWGNIDHQPLGAGNEHRRHHDDQDQREDRGAGWKIWAVFHNWSSAQLSCLTCSSARAIAQLTANAIHWCWFITIM